MALIREHQPPRDAHLAVVTLPAEGAPGFVSAEDDAARPCLLNLSVQPFTSVNQTRVAILPWIRDILFCKQEYMECDYGLSSKVEVGQDER